MKKKDWVVEKFGKPCPKCKKRHSVFASIGHNLPNDNRKECK